MKKLYSALILCCLNVVAFAQTMTSFVNATGTPGSFKTGYAEKGSPSIRVDGDLQAHYSLSSPVGDRRGWAVFDLNGVVPPGASVQSVNLRFTISGVTDVNPSSVGLFGYVGDLSTVTNPDLVFAGCNGSGIYTGSNFNGSSWGASAATLTLPFNSAGVGFINTNAPGIVTIGWQSTSNSLQTYTITGENGVASTQPRLEIVYTCNGISSVTATAAPGTLCSGATLSLTSTGTGVSSWLWQGPSGYASTSPNPTLPVTMTSAGVYTLTAFNAASCGTKAYTFPVTVNPLPAAITGPTTVCIGAAGTITLSNSSGAGTWTSSNTAIATVNLNTGVVGGVAPGVANITFTLASTGCSISRPVLAIATPTAISGPHSVCENGGTVSLSEAVTGGTWSSSNSAVASVSNAGVVTPFSPGNILITYSNGCSPNATYTFTVNPMPAAIGGANSVCSGASINLTETSTGGAWSSSNTRATVSGTGQVTGVATGVVHISYTFTTGCFVTKTVSVNPTPPPIATATICSYDSVTLTASGFPGAWSSLNTTVATIDASLGTVKAKSPGIAVIKFTTLCNVSVTTTVTVLPAPAPIKAIFSVCNGLTTYLSDATPGGTWSSLDPTVATVPYVDSGRIYGNTVGVTRITYGITNGCVATASFTVTGPPPPAPIAGAGTVCVGQTIQLSQVTGVGWWQSSNVALATVDSFSGVVKGTGMGFVNVTYTIGTGNGCTAWKTIQVHPLDPITGVDSICHGSTTYLADIVGSGTWSSSVSSVATIHPASGFVQSLTPGVTRITYVTPQGCITTKSLTVIAIPAPVTGPTQTCPGQSITLSNAVANPKGVWTTSNTTIAKAQYASPTTGTITGVGADTVTVIYTVRPGCTTSTVITVNPNPAPITGTNGICATTQDTVFDATIGGTWSISPTSLATIDTDGVIQTLSAGTVNITYTLPLTGCRSVLTIPVRPLPVANLTFNSSVNTIYADSGYVTYQWYGTLEGLIVGANSRSIAGLETQGYYVVVTDTFGCVGTSAVFPYDVHMGVNDPDGTEVRIFPNPATTMIRIESAKPLRAVITTIDGKAVMEKENARQVDISNLANGMYFVVLYNDRNQAIATRKLIKQ